MESSIWPSFEVEYITSISIEVKILYTIIAITLFPIAYALIFGIIQFEVEEGDPQKRSIFNQLHSALFSTMEIYAFIGSTIIFARIWVGPLGFATGFLFTLTRRFYLSFVAFLVSSMLVIKIIRIIWPKFLDRLNDNFWSILIILLNIVFSFVVPIADWYSYPQGKYPVIFCFLSGECNMTTSKDHQLMFLILWSIALVLLCLYMMLRLCHQPYSDSASEIQQSQGLSLNNLAHNPAIIGNVQISIIVLAFLCGSLPAIMLVHKSPDFFILGSLCGSLSSYLLVPILLYIFNKKLRKHWKTLILKCFHTNKVAPQANPEIAVIEPSGHEETASNVEAIELTAVENFK